MTEKIFFLKIKLLSLVDIKGLENFRTKDKKLITKYLKEDPWGMSACVDLKKCNPRTMRDASKIKIFVDQLCKLLKVKKFGKTIVVNFGQKTRIAGFSMTQLIETSLISGHFANQSNAIYLDVFSCKQYEPFKTAEFSKKFFGAKSYDLKINFRY